MPMGNAWEFLGCPTRSRNMSASGGARIRANEPDEPRAAGRDEPLVPRRNQADRNGAAHILQLAAHARREVILLDGKIERDQVTRRAAGIASSPGAAR